MRGDRGQSTVEWVGLVLLVAVMALSLAATGIRPPGLSLAVGLAERLVCAAGLDWGQCLSGAASELEAEYGPELAVAATSHAPRIEYEPGMRAVPVDFRRCRGDPCSLGAERGAVSRSESGEAVTLFVHAVDCRPAAALEARRRGWDCSGERAGNLYLQYWAYYPGSQTARELLGASGFHPDDWESFQVRISPDGAAARASSHSGYNYTAGPGSWLSDAGVTARPAWGPDDGRYYVSGGSHAGHAHESPPGASRTTMPGGRASAAAYAARLRAARRAAERYTPATAIRLVPIEALGPHRRRWRFAITPPWRKRVYTDPEYEGTD